MEVKDWVQIERADPEGATIRTRKNETRFEPNPVNKAREFAILLSNELKGRKNHTPSGGVNVPWGYAAVLYNLPTTTITQLRRPWGEEFVWNESDLSVPDVLTMRLRNTISTDHIRTLNRAELDQIRATISPVVEIQPTQGPAFVLDTEQEKIIAEPVRPEPQPESRKQKEQNQARNQANLFAAIQQDVEESPLPEEEEKVSQNFAIRLVRGIAGSGKTLVLTQRARYLAAQYPEWQIGVLSFNDELASCLEADLHGYGNIKVQTFHKLCSRLLRNVVRWSEPTHSEGWINRNHHCYPELEGLSARFLSQEVTWMKDMGITSLDQYKKIERRGRGAQARLTKAMREHVYKMLEDYHTYLEKQKLRDWADIPHLVLEKLASGEIQFPPYDAVLLDEAQDFAPSWIKVVQAVVKKDQGAIFMADDPTQSIYRYFSWKEKGIPVVGRTHRLSVPYRNTYEICKLAEAIVQGDSVLQQSLEDESMLVTADYNPDTMRRGPKPLVRKSKSPFDDAAYLRTSIEKLLQDGVDGKRIAVLHRRTRGVRSAEQTLKGLDVRSGTYHAFKGLEFDTVFLCDVHETFQGLADEHELSEERRLLYMAVTRARRQLIMTYQGVLPKEIRALSEWMDVIN